jgi:outer membrane protein assembly factor BamA
MKHTPRILLAAVLAAALCVAPAAFAQLEPPREPVLADTAGTVPQRDAMDVIAELLGKRVEPEVSGTTTRGLSWAILPTISYNPVYGVALGAMLSGAGQRGEGMRFSQIAISGNYSTEGQTQLQARGDVFSPSEDFLVKGDVRFLNTNRKTWGLGHITPEQEEYPMAFKLLRVYGTVYRRASGPVYLGLGYHYDEFMDIVDERAEQGESTPFSDYSGGTPGTTVASGMSLNVLGDTRDNLVNPSSGYYLSASFRDYLKTLGSDHNWQELWIEMRLYPHVPKRSKNVLAFWVYTWLSFGEAPYLNLPSNGWDTYGRGARGYLQGRIRGASQLYYEAEYRFSLREDGLLGMVGFFNATTTTDPESNIFSRSDFAAGVGLRVKFNKRSNTNVTVDYGWGRTESRGLFLGMSEAF